MAIYARPAFAVESVNAAAKSLSRVFLSMDRSTEGVGHSIEIINNFRAAHAFPLNTFLMTLRNRAIRVHGSALTAQRIKRLESIVTKLLNEPEMKLSQMQDIGGCRAILPSLKDVQRLRDIYADRPLTHRFNGEKNYIAYPKPTGYRGVHLKYRFVGKGASLPWHGLKIEIQLRTALQHKWATAVEAAATFTRQALKSNRGPAEWLRFFALTSSVFALREGCPPIPGTPPTISALEDEIRVLNRAHLIQSTFAQYRAIIPHIERQSKAKYFLVVLDPAKREVRVSGFAGEASREANRAYTEAETTLPKTTNVVLVSVSSISALKRAYPNYFMDTQDFLKDLSTITGEAVPD